MDKTKTDRSMEEAIRSLIEGAYVLSPLYPGNWKNYEEVDKKFHELYASRFETPCSSAFGELLQAHFPDANVKEDVTPKGYGQTIKALRINADKLSKIQSLTKKLDRAFNNKKVEEHAHGWKSLSEVGTPELVDECVTLGFNGVRQAFEVLRKNKYEFAGDLAIRLAVADAPQTAATAVEASPAVADIATESGATTAMTEAVESAGAEKPQDGMYSLVMEAYKQTPYYSGNWRNCEDVANKFYELAAERLGSDAPQDFEAVAASVIPADKLKYYEDFKPKGETETFKAIKILAVETEAAPAPVPVAIDDLDAKVQEFKKKLFKAYQQSDFLTGDYAEWKALEQVAGWLTKDDWNAVGCKKIKNAIETHGQDLFELLALDQKGLPPMVLRLIAPVTDDAAEFEALSPNATEQQAESNADDKMRGMLEDAYAMAPAQKGMYRKCDDLRQTFEQLYAERCGEPYEGDFDELLAVAFPSVKAIDYKAEGEEETFKAIKIPTASAQKTIVSIPATIDDLDAKVQAFRKKLATAYQKTDFMTGDYGKWKALDQVALSLTKDDWNAVGCEKIKIAIDLYCQDMFELLALSQKGLPPMLMRQISQVDDKIRGMLEVAYAMTPAQKGNYRKCEDLRQTFEQLYAERCEEPYDGDFDKLLASAYPTVNAIDYKAEGADETFKALKIPADQLTISGRLKYLINTAFNNTPASSKLPEGWKYFASVSSTVSKELSECSKALGFKNAKEAIEALCNSHYEFKQDDKVLMIRQLKPILTGPTGPDSEKPTPRRTDLSLGKALGEFAYFPSKSADQSGWALAIDSLAAKAIKENWHIRKKDEAVKPILRNYLSYTFDRLEYETETLKKNKIVKTADHAIFNTGLVDSCYEPIYAVFKKNTHPDKQPWIFYDFVTKTDGDQIINKFPSLPDPAEYYTDRAELLYDITAGKPTFNMKHIFCDNVNRLPHKFVSNGAPDNYPLKDKSELVAMTPDARKAYYEKLGQDIMANDRWKRKLSNLFDMAITQAINRVKWNYKNAIPVYYIYDKCVSICLPLDLEDNGRYDVSLVCKRHGGQTSDGQKFNNYEGRTIFTPDMVCNNARLIVRPNSDWFPAAE